MKVIVCLDERNGMMFNHRRQSQDRFVIADIANRINGESLWMNGYSAPLFTADVCIKVSEQFLAEAPAEAWCFVEDQALDTVKASIEVLVVYRWHRHYPADRHLDLDLEEWTLATSVDFQGYSHEKITREEYHQ